MGQLANVTDDDISINSCPVLKKQTSGLSWFQRKIIVPESTLKAGSARLEASEVVFGWFDKGVINLHVICIFVIVDAITIDKSAD